MTAVNSKRCESCGTCVGVCPADAISMTANVLVIDHGRCIDCGACVAVCPVGALDENEPDAI